MSVRSLSFEDFQHRVGQTFTMRYPTDAGADEAAEAAGAEAAGATHEAAGATPEAACDAVLTECARSSVSGASRSFNLLFRAGPDAPREQGTYLLGRDDFEPAPIFLVPVRALADGVEFHAVFNPSTEAENVP
jgi:hypothetical protein